MREELVRTIDETISSWPDVRGKQVFGHRGFVRGGKMFAFIAEDGLGVKVTDEAKRTALYGRPGVKPFVYNGTMEMKQWPVLPLLDDAGVAEALSVAHEAYASL